MTRAVESDPERAVVGARSKRARTDILFVCTANQCRSPLAEAIARREATTLPVRFASAGLLEGGHRMPPTGVQVASELGLDLTGHLSKQVDFATVLTYDVVLTMTREQARELVAVQPDLWPRVFTVKQFSRWLEQHPRPARGRLGTWLAIEAAERPRTDLLGSDQQDDVRDPLISPPKVWRSVANELAEHIRKILASLFPG
jgi:protein-tyrosine-phosphatase